MRRSKPVRGETAPTGGRVSVQSRINFTRKLEELREKMVGKLNHL